MLIGYGALLWLCLFAATRSGELGSDIHVGKPHLTGKAPLACEEVAMADGGQAFFSMRLPSGSPPRIDNRASSPYRSGSSPFVGDCGPSTMLCSRPITS